jgi:D-hexose-6-phosphate mutarotase
MYLLCPLPPPPSYASHGATVTSVKTGGGQQLLFLSEAANFDGASPIRGGVPLIFPKFGGGWDGVRSHNTDNLRAPHLIVT